MILILLKWLMNRFELLCFTLIGFSEQQLSNLHLENCPKLKFQVT